MDSGGANSATELSFTLRNEEYPFVGVSEAVDCRFELVRMLPREEDRYAEYFAVERADPESVRDRLAGRQAVEPSLLVSRDSRGLFELVVSEHCPARELAELGAIPTAVVGDEGTGYIEAEVPPKYDETTIIEEFMDDYASASLRTKRELDRTTPLLSGTELRPILAERLTERQREVLRTAYESGYYERPREATGQELADDLDISVATFSQHIRAAERKLLTLLYENEPEPSLS